MHHIKLNATDSTNNYLKQLFQESETENYTVITAESQTNGRGQMGTKWLSESGKNLIVSILIKDCLKESTAIFNLNVAIAIALYDSLNYFEIPDLSIKWANDILSGNKKIAGILIENIIKSNCEIVSIIGFGMNVNQTNFENLPKASSLKNITGKTFDRDLILLKIVENIKLNCILLQEKQEDLLWEKYNKLVFRKNKPTVFERSNYQKFMGIIQTVTRDGKLQILLENDKVEAFEVKEIQMLY
jgi:BirA family transcriptional regulator, biotin operon repressor / biotin---[acetyl-CoA-carboxylase] ligase